MIDGYLHERFADAIRSIEIAEKDHGGIGTYNEKTLHAVLKNFFEPDSAYHEIPVDNYIADIKNPDGIIEIQTSGFGTIRDRLEVFLSLSEVTVVYPIAAVKSLVWIDPETGAAESKRKSPKRENAAQILPEMCRLCKIIKNERLHFVCAMLELTEYRIRDGWGNGGKRGSHRLDRIPTGIIDIVEIKTPEDLRRFVPDGEFTSKDFASFSGFSPKSRRDISMALKLLEYTGTIEKCGKKRNAVIYRGTSYLSSE